MGDGLGKTPAHVAIIMDGNGRWAQKRGRPRIYGHVRGAWKVKPIVKAADQLGIKALTLFAFSTENWLRPKDEVEVLWRLMIKFLRKETFELHSNNVRLRVIGEWERLPERLRNTALESMKLTENNTGLQLTLAVSYGSRREIVLAAQKFTQACIDGKVRVDDLNEEVFKEYLWTAPLGELAEVDFVIRTSGELRVSNFLLWQAAYAEFSFVDECWPDFSVERFEGLIRDFEKRKRRFGVIEGASVGLRKGEGKELTHDHQIRTS